MVKALDVRRRLWGVVANQYVPRSCPFSAMSCFHVFYTVCTCDKSYLRDIAFIIVFAMLSCHSVFVKLF
jgi:hypothetical protein